MYTYNLDIDENVEPTYIYDVDDTTKNKCHNECQQIFGTCVEKNWQILFSSIETEYFKNQQTNKII